MLKSLGGLIYAPSDIIYVTDRGKLELETELACLRHLRRQAAEQADLKPGGRDAAAQSAEVAALDREIRELKSALSRSTVVADPSQQVGVGSQVTLRDEQGEELVVTIVGPFAANPRLQHVSYQSTLGQSLLGRSVGDIVDVDDLGELWRVRICKVTAMPGDPLAAPAEGDQDEHGCLERVAVA